jgi:hypothetical protein
MVSFPMSKPSLPVVPPQPAAAPPLQPVGSKPQARGDNPTVLGAIAPTQQQQTSGTKTLLGA